MFHLGPKDSPDIKKSGTGLLQISARKMENGR